MQNYGILVILFIFILFSFYAYSTIFNTKTLTDINQVYQNFTPEMKEEFDFHLSLIECRPETYYFEETAVCFNCEWSDACFNYGFVERAGGTFMNVVGKSQLKHFKEVDLRVLDFYNYGLGSYLKCEKHEDQRFYCSYDTSFVYVGDRFIINYKNELNKQEFSKIICEYFNETFIGCEESLCYCDEKAIGFLEGEATIYSWYL